MRVDDWQPQEPLREPVLLAVEEEDGVLGLRPDAQAQPVGLRGDVGGRRPLGVREPERLAHERLEELANQGLALAVGESLQGADLVDLQVRAVLGVVPGVGAKLPIRVKRKNTYLSAEQLRLLAEHAGRYRSSVLLLGTAGLRWGEAAALRVQDVDFLRRRVELHRNAVAIGRRRVVGTLKSGKARTVALATFVVNELAVTCEGKGRDELIWPSADGGYLGPPSSTESWLAGAVGRCQRTDPTFPRVTAHALRHTAASLAISSGANVKVVQRMLGHASAAMTLDVYADLFESDLTAVADKLDETVGRMWAKWREDARRPCGNDPLPAPTGTEHWSLLSGLN